MSTCRLPMTVGILIFAENANGFVEVCFWNLFKFCRARVQTPLEAGTRTSRNTNAGSESVEFLFSDLNGHGAQTYWSHDFVSTL